jgi:hypothetical protein
VRDAAQRAYEQYNSPNVAQSLQTQNTVLTPALNALRDACQSNLGACFGAGTPLLTPDGHKAIEKFAVGDAILSRSEYDPAGPLEVKRVEEVFVRTGRIMNLHAGGQVIRTTAEHPFWVQGLGWVSAEGLRPGDLLRSRDGESVPVEEVYDTGEYETLYNLQIADYHTYFVGYDEWGFSVWAHNDCIYHYGAPGKTVLPVGTWVTSSDLPYAEALLIINYPGPTLSKYTFDESLGDVDWNFMPVNRHPQGRLRLAVGVPPAVETPVPNP